MDFDDTQQPGKRISTPGAKRKLGETDFEVADSEDEDYGWADDDELPPMPSQWQGSEDLLLTRQPESDEEDEDEQPVDVGDQEPDDGVAAAQESGS